MSGLSNSQNEIAQLKAEVDFLKIEFLSSADVLAAAQDLQARWPNLKTDEKRAVVESITVSDNEITIDLAYVPNAAKPPPTPNWKDRTKSPHTLGGRRIEFGWRATMSGYGDRQERADCSKRCHLGEDCICVSGKTQTWK